MSDAWLTLPSWAALDLYSLTVLGVTLFSAIRVRGRRTARERIFGRGLVYQMALTGFHALMSLGEELGVGWLRELGTTASFAFNPGILAFWISYSMTFFTELGDEDETARHSPERWALRLAFVANIVVALTNHWSHLLYFYDAAGAYHRGPLFLVRYGICLLLGLLTFATLLSFRERVGRQTTPWLLLAPLAPLLGALMQPHTHMLGLELVGVTFSCAMLNLFVQGRMSTTDALTGLGNRRELEMRFARLREQALSGRPFGAVMIDVDRFKQINDGYGHGRGDDALVAIADAMRAAFGVRSTLVRLSGDEFMALVPTGDTGELERLCAALRTELGRAAASAGLPFAIEVSLGWDVFDPARFDGRGDFVQHLDEMLYAEKERKGAARD